MASLKKIFTNYSVIVFGSKGTGKDLTFQKAIYSRHKPYYALMDYGERYENVKIKDMQFEGNDFEQILQNDFKLVGEKQFKEKQDFYLSDLGIFLPSQYNGILDKKYKGLPLFYALTRHAYDSNIHCNTQYLGRVWNKIREQADIYIRCRWTISIPFILITKLTLYDKYETALRDMRPLKHKTNRKQKTDVDAYNASNGLLKTKYFAILKKHVSYDTRYFHRKLFGVYAPTKKEQTRDIKIETELYEINKRLEKELKDNDKKRD